MEFNKDEAKWEEAEPACAQALWCVGHGKFQNRHGDRCCKGDGEGSLKGEIQEIKLQDARLHLNFR